MIDEFGVRLRSARKMAGMSMDALVRKTGAVVSKQAIGKYEKGQIKPSSDVLLAIAKALEIKVDYFFRSSKVSIVGMEFRKRSRLARKDEERIRYQAIDFLQKYLELEEIIGIHPHFANPVSDNRIKDFQDIERAATTIREKWNLGDGPIPHLIEFLEDKGFKLVEVDASDDVDGLSGFVTGLDIPVIAVMKHGDLVRKRFTVAHELGHLLLDFAVAREDNTEKLCHAFAGALLLPEKVLREELGERRNKITEWELKKLKGIFGISMQAIMARAFQLGIINEQTYRRFNIYVNTHGWRKEEPGEYVGKEKANRFKQLICHAAAEQIISYSKVAELLNVPLTEVEREVHVVS